MGCFAASSVTSPAADTTPTFWSLNCGRYSSRRLLSGRRPSSFSVSAPTLAMIFVIEARLNTASRGMGLPAPLSRKP